MEYITVKGLIVQQTDFNEADRMLTILTDTEGVVSVKAAGVKSLKRKDISGAKLFIYGEYILTKSGDHYGLKECNIITPFFDISNDIESLGIGCYILDIAGSAALPGEPNMMLLRLTLNTLYALNQGKTDKKLIKAAYELKVCDLIGYTPHTFECLSCFEEISEIAEKDAFCYFDMLNGGITCKNCVGIPDKNIIKINMATVNAINYVIDADIKAYLSFNLKQEFLSELSEICEKFFLLHSGFKPKSLDYLANVK